jgi:SAM-dependent methyltransferase
MKLLDLVNRSAVPEPWSEGDNIPWHEPGFSQRMLKEHLSQEHDAASRRFEKIDQHVAWIHQHLLSAEPTQILDLACGPGLYASRLSRLGHECMGLDYSPASIAYAVEEAAKDKLRCSYRQQDIRQAEYGTGFGLAMLIFGELNIFRPADARAILRKAHRALAHGGLLLLEPHTFDAVRQIGERPPSWYTVKTGLFSDQPHLYLEESFWDAERRTATKRYFVVDASTGQVTRCAHSFQAYSEAEYRALLSDCGFDDVAFFPSLTGVTDESQLGLLVVVARK